MRTTWLIAISAAAVLALAGACRPAHNLRPPYHEPVATQAAPAAAQPASPAKDR